MSGRRLGRLLQPWKKDDSSRSLRASRAGQLISANEPVGKEAETLKKRAKKISLRKSKDLAVVLSESLVMLRDSADACPPLKSVTGGLVHIVRVIEVSADKQYDAPVLKRTLYCM